MREKESFTSIIPEYGRRKLLMFADSIRELASTFSDMDKLSARESALIAEAEGIPEGFVNNLEEGYVGNLGNGSAVFAGKSHEMSLGDGYVNNLEEDYVSNSVNGFLNNLGSGAINSIGNGAVNSMGNGAVNSMGNGAVNSMGNGAVNGMGNGAVNGMGNGAGNNLGRGVDNNLGNGYGNRTGGSVESKGMMQVEDRKDVLWQRRMQENKGIMADHLQEVAQLMTRVAEESRRFMPMGERRYKQIAHALKEVNVQVKDIYMLENEDGHMEMSLVLRSNKANNAISVEEIGDVISVLMNNRMTPSMHNPFFIGPEWKNFYYVEAARFHVLTGVAKAVKETEKISGDNYAIFEAEPGNLSVILSDGMGSGVKANKDSSMIVELMQKFLEAGFHKEIAIQMINSALLAGLENGNMSTLDLCKIDLYNGYCEFVKIGSSCSYIKREHLVDRISAGNLPLGIFNRPDMEIVKRRLLDGDYIVMVSDGILDALSQGIGEDMMSELIGGTDLRNPGEIANALLNFCIHQSKGKIRDDMTVLVIGIWEKDLD